MFGGSRNLTAEIQRATFVEHEAVKILYAGYSKLTTLVIGHIFKDPISQLPCSNGGVKSKTLHINNIMG